MISYLLRGCRLPPVCAAVSELHLKLEVLVIDHDYAFKNIGHVDKPLVIKGNSAPTLNFPARLPGLPKESTLWSRDILKATNRVGTVKSMLPSGPR